MLLLLFLVSFSSKADNICPVTQVGLCDPIVVEEITNVDVVTETINDGTGVTTITTTTTDINTTKVTNETSVDILDSDNGFVPSSKDGKMSIDWGGQGSASMPSGSTCGDLGTDKCAMITGSGNSTSINGVSGMGTTFVQTIDISDLDISNGGKTNYSIKVYKPDKDDSIYMHITGKNGAITQFSGTDVLSASGVVTGYSEYNGGFEFAGNLTSLIVEVGGRDIALSVGVMFDDVSVNVLYNVISNIVSQTITSVESYVAINIVDDTITDLLEDIFDNNIIEVENGNIEITPTSQTEVTYDSVEAELAPPSAEQFEIKLETETGENINAEVSIQEIETELEIEVSEVEVEVKVKTETVSEKVEVAKVKTVDVKKPITKAEIKTQKIEKAKAIVKKMGKDSYSSANQQKQLLIISVLGDTKTFFDSQQKQLTDITGFFSDVKLSGGTISDNNLSSYLMNVYEDQAMNDLVNLQYR